MPRSSALPCRAHRVLEQHRDRHRAYTTWHRCDVGSDATRALEMHVTDEAVSLGRPGIVDTIDADVDDDRAGANHVARQHFRFAYRGDDDVRALRMEREVLGAAMTHRNGAITALP